MSVKAHVARLERQAGAWQGATCPACADARVRIVWWPLDAPKPETAASSACGRCGRSGPKTLFITWQRSGDEASASAVG
jgi:hypothetical protein